MSAWRAERVVLAAIVAAAMATPAVAAPDTYDPARYRVVLEHVTARRTELGARYAAARSGQARAAIRNEARRFVVETLVSQVFPAWMGMPSGGGPQATASLPHEPGMYISCSLAKDARSPPSAALTSETSAFMVAGGTPGVFPGRARGSTAVSAFHEIVIDRTTGCRAS